MNNELPPRPVRTSPPRLLPIIVPDFDDRGGPPINPSQLSPNAIDYARWARLEAINRAERLEREAAKESTLSPPSPDIARVEERTPAPYVPSVRGDAAQGFVGIGIVVGIVVAIVSTVRKGKRA